MGTGNHKKLLRFLASPIICVNHTWSPSSTSKRPQINTGKGNQIRTISRTRPISTIHKVRRHQSFLPQDSGSNRKILYGPNRKVIGYIQQGKQVYTDSIPLWIQQHPCRISENKIRPGFKYSLPETPQPIDQQRVETAPTYSGKWMSKFAQKFHKGGKWDISVSPAPHPLQKLSRTGHLCLQGAFHSRNIEYPQEVPWLASTATLDHC